MKLIVNTDINWGIGKNNGLLFSNREDMRFFRETTTGAAVVMGRKTLESFPEGKPLKNRVNIVMTRSDEYENDEVIVCRTRAELKRVLDTVDTEVYLIGGASMYNEFMDCCDEAYVTFTFADGGADCFINPLDVRDGWVVEERGEPRFDDEAREFRFMRYSNGNVMPL